MDPLLRSFADRLDALVVPYAKEVDEHGRLELYPGDGIVVHATSAGEDPRCWVRLVVPLGVDCAPVARRHRAMLQRQSDCVIAKVGITEHGEADGIVDVRAGASDDEIRIALFALINVVRGWGHEIESVLDGTFAVAIADGTPWEPGASEWSPEALSGSDDVESTNVALLAAASSAEHVPHGVLREDGRLTMRVDDDGLGVSLSVRVREVASPYDDRLAPLLGLNHTLRRARIEIDEWTGVVTVEDWLPAAAIDAASVAAVLDLLGDAAMAVGVALGSAFGPVAPPAVDDAGDPPFGEYVADGVPHRVGRPKGSRRLTVIERWQPDTGWRIVSRLPSGAIPIHGPRLKDEHALADMPSPTNYGFEEWFALLESLREPLGGAINGLLENYDFEWHYSSGASDHKYNREAMDGARRALALLAAVDAAVIRVRAEYPKLTGGHA